MASSSSQNPNPLPHADLIARTRRGGRRQRQYARVLLASATADPQHPKADFDSKLALHLLREWAWGQISAAELQRLAAKAYEDQKNLVALVRAQLNIDVSDDLCSKTLRALANLGSNGVHSNNCQRDLKAFLGAPSTPQPLKTQINVVVQKPVNHRLRPFVEKNMMSFFYLT